MPLCLSLLKHIVFFSSASHLTVTFFPIYGQKYENSPAKKKLLLCNLDNHLLSSLLLYSYILKRFTKNENFVLTKHFFYAIIIFSKVENNALSEVGTGSCPAYEKLFGLRCCFRIPLLQNRYFSYLFAVYLQKGFFIMKKRISKLSTRNLTNLSMLLAIAVIFGMFFTSRPDPYTKIPIKFIPVAISAMLFGPVWGGIVGALADVISYSINPAAGAMLPQIIVIEFLYGFSYGLFLKNIIPSKSGYFKTIFFTIIQIIILHVLLTTLALLPVYKLSFKTLFILRTPGFIINTVLQLLGILYIIKYSSQLKKIAGIR